MTGAMLTLAQVGVDVLRLDAVPFLWKRMGTNCQNQPEVHLLLRAFRAAVRIAAPAVAFKAEAIVAQRDLIPYFGTGRGEGNECDLAYHNAPR
jgi:amylosucrase